MSCFDSLPKFTAGQIPVFEENDPVNHPKHYLSVGAICANCKCRIECIDVTRNFDFNLGNAIKYIWRAKFKENTKQDLEKAIWYLNDFINNHCQGDK